MGAAKIQGASGAVAGETSLAFPTNVKKHSLLRVAIRSGTLGDVLVVTDSLGQDWIQADPGDWELATDGDQLYEFYFPNSIAGACTVSVAGATATCRMLIEEYGGVALGSPVRGTNFADGTGTSVGSGDVFAAFGDLVCGTVGNTNTPDGDWTAGGTSSGGTWATGQDLIDPGGSHSIYTQFCVATAGGAFESQPVFSTTDEIGSGVVVYKAGDVGQFPVTPIIITGIGANGPLPSPWEGPAWEDPFEMVISSNFMTSAGDDEGTSMYNVLLNADQESYVTIDQFSTEDVHAPVLLHLRMDGINGTGAGYYIGLDSTGEFGILNAVTFDTIFGPITIPGVGNGDSLGFRAQGSVLSAWYKPAGGAWGLIVSIVDTTFPNGGYLYMDCFDDTFKLSNFGGGNLVEFLENEDTLDLLLLENGTPIELETSQ